MMLLRARDNNIQSFACIWLHKRNQNEFPEHPKIKWLDGGNFVLISFMKPDEVCFDCLRFKTKQALKRHTETYLTKQKRAF